MKKTCLDCLHCKVSANSTEDCRLCFCSLSKLKERHKEKYWYKKTPCKKFFDMTEGTTLIFFHTSTTTNNLPLIRRKALERQ